MSTFSERLEAVMREKNISQARLATLTGIPKSAISQYLNGKYKPKDERAMVFARTLNVNTAWLRGMDDKRTTFVSVKKTGIQTIVSKNELKIISLYRENGLVKSQIDSIVSDIQPKKVFRAANSDSGTVPPSCEKISRKRLQIISNSTVTDEDL